MDPQAYHINLSTTKFLHLNGMWFEEKIKILFRQVIGHCGLLRKKTRIMVTSETKFLEQTDYIIVMKNQVNEPLMSVNDA